jgi:putative DNA methylase
VSEKVKAAKKLIEVALPLPEINDASAYDKMPGIGPHPKGIHHWWARLPLPTARAVLFASVVDDPGEHPAQWATEELQNAERERLFDIIRNMMQKKLHDHPEVYAKAQAEMLKHTGGRLPLVFDPFAGGGSIPLEANRMGFQVSAGDLNPIAVMMNKCNLELAPRWSGHIPVNPESRRRIGGSEGWIGTRGLSEDIKYYARQVGASAQKELENLYPPARLGQEYGNREAKVVAWVWARTVPSPDPAVRGTHVPLLSTYWLSNKKGREIWVQSIVNRERGEYHFQVRSGVPADRTAISAGTKMGKGGFRCLLTDSPIPFEYIRDQGQNGQLGFVLVAVVADGPRGRLYLPPTADQTEAASLAKPSNYPDTDLPDEALGFRIQNYGIRKHWQMFTARQLTSIAKLSNLVQSIGTDITRQAGEAGLSSADTILYASAVVTFLALAIDRCADFNNALCRWSASNQKVMNLFGRQAIPMVWDFAEANILGESVGSWSTCSEYVADCVAVLSTSKSPQGSAHQLDAANGQPGLKSVLVSTDPPYYDNIGYAALSDFFYVWLRRTIGSLYPDIFSTVLVPQLPELIASPDRYGGDARKAKEHFESGFRLAFASLRDQMHPAFPLTVYYAFKQDDQETESDSLDEEATPDLTTGWETLLEALISNRFQITATWPVRASQAWRMRAMGANALASYIVLACRLRPVDAPTCDRRSFVGELKRELPLALRHLQQGNIAPVDFAQAALGPGMAIYSRYSAVIESSGSNLSVRTALSLINQTLTEVLSEQEDELDRETRWATAWYEQHGFEDGEFGEAELLSKAKVTSLSGLQHSGLVQSKGGKVRLLKPDELSDNWIPDRDGSTPIWRMTHQLLKLYFYKKSGDSMTAELLRKFGSRGDEARNLAYRLFDISEKKKRSQEAQGYNALVLGWPEIAALARAAGTQSVTQTGLFKESEG